MRTLVKMQFGSQVYGTSVPDSDQDFKSVYVPRGDDLLLGNVPKRSISQSTGNKDGKNTADDIDHEMFTLKGYLDLLCDGQTVAVDMLFVPSKFYETVTLDWCDIKRNKNLLLSKNIKGFLGYCMSQASKYGIKGSRMYAAKNARAMFQDFMHEGGNLKVHEFSTYIFAMAGGYEHIDVVTIPQPDGRPDLPHLEVCGKKVPFTASVAQAFKVYDTLYENYGQRTRDAMNNENIDWKAMMHAVRIGQQAVELLRTENIIFPRPNAGYLLTIRNGVLPYQQVAEELEELLEQIKVASGESTLLYEPDRDFARELTLDAYQREVQNGN